MKRVFFLSKKKHRVTIQQKITYTLLNIELLYRITKHNYKGFLKKKPTPKIKACCKINGIYGQTNKHTNLNRHFIRLNVNEKLLEN